MPRKRRLSTTSLQDTQDDDIDYCVEEKYNNGRENNNQDSMDGARAPRNAANARERARMRVLSKAFCRLKTTLPWVPADTKLSKLDTLRLAATYIAHLRAVLKDEGESHPESTRSLSLALSWPFAIQGAGAPILTNNNSTSGSSSSTSSSPIGQYRNDQSLQDGLLQSENNHNHSHHHHHHHHHHNINNNNNHRHHHQGIHLRHNHHEPQVPYYN